MTTIYQEQPYSENVIATVESRFGTHSMWNDLAVAALNDLSETTEHTTTDGMRIAYLFTHADDIVSCSFSGRYTVTNGNEIPDQDMDDEVSLMGFIALSVNRSVGIQRSTSQGIVRFKDQTIIADGARKIIVTWSGGDPSNLTMGVEIMSVNNVHHLCEFVIIDGELVGVSYDSKNLPSAGFHAAIKIAYDLSRQPFDFSQLTSI